MINLLANFPLYLKSTYLTLHIAFILLSYIAFFVASFAAILYLIQDNSLKAKQSRAISSRLPDLSFLDKLNYKSISMGFPILTLAIISGLLWAKNIWGSYWNWNPRVIYSLILWLVYAVTLHVRLSSKMRGRKVSLLSILALFVIILTLFSSYGGVR